MLFNSIHFAIFFPIVLLLYFSLGHRWRWVLLLVASCYFYMVFVPAYILVLAFTIAVDYAAGLLIEPARGARRRALLLLSIAANVGILAAFKYYNFFAANVSAAGHLLGADVELPALTLLLPLGLSFHTFQAMSYTIEVYRGHVAAERHLGIYALYVMFFPQLVAGPIERPQNLLPQLRGAHVFERGRVASGLTLMGWGLLKKIVIADTLGTLADPAFARSVDFPGPALVLATVCFAFQIYFDFSGYSDIALGSAEVMGIRLMRNFDCPYSSRSFADFWKRWHISLSSWLRDYVFLPVSISLSRRFDRDRWLGLSHDAWVYGSAAMITMLLSGLWHGAGWSFVCWGGLHGMFLSVGFATRKARRRLAAVIARKTHPGLVTAVQVVATFALGCIAWVFFRARSVEEALTLLSRMVLESGAWLGRRAKPVALSHLLLDDPVSVSFVGVLLVAVLWVETFDRRRDARAWLAGSSGWVRWSIYYGMAVLILVFAEVEQSQPFIYFQF